MRQASLSMFLGPALVLYLVADVASAGGGLSSEGFLAAGAAVLTSLLAFNLRSYEGQRGVRRSVGLAIALALSLVRYVDPEPMLLLADVALVTGLCCAGALLLDLSLRVPDSLMAPRWERAAVRGGYAGALAVWGWEMLALLPPLPRPDIMPIVPPLGGLLALLMLAACCCVALALRLSRRALRSTPEALAENAWAVFGLLPVTPLLLWACARALTLGGHPVVVPPAALSAVAVLLAASHRRLVDAEQRLRVGHTSRALVTASLALGGVFALGAFSWPWLPRTQVMGGLLLLLGTAVFRGLYQGLRPMVLFLLAPAHGQLLAALSPELKLSASRRLESLSADVLARLRLASGDSSSEPKLYTLDPAIEASIDAAGQAHLVHRLLHPQLLSTLRAAPGDIIVRSTLEAQNVRQPSLRPLIDALVDPDLLCVVPLTLEGELEGALLVPRGERRSALTLEELDALGNFATAVASQLSALCAEARAQQRSHHAQQEAERLLDRDELLQDELARLRADAVVLRAGRMAHRMQEQPIAYSPAMRAMLVRLEEVSASDAPLLLHAEGGTPLDALAYRVHQHSGRGGEAFVIGDCAAIASDEAMAALFGDAENPNAPGLLKLAAEGTLLLLDVPALPLSVQAALCEALSTRQARPLGAAEAFPVSVRLVAGTRVDLTTAAEAECFDPGLAQRLGALSLRVPPLRERREDLESLILLAIARACGVHARAPVGIDPDASRLLRDYDFPGNQGELRSLIERAVGRCSGSRITVADLPILPTHPAPVEAAKERALSGTLESVERAALEHALSRSHGNKSEAARMLGLKRTTFLDKLRRHGLEDPPAKRPRPD